MLEGKNVNLRIMERDDLSVVKEWDNDIGIMGEYEPIVQEIKADLERQFDNQFLLNHPRMIEGSVNRYINASKIK